MYTEKIHTPFFRNVKKKEKAMLTSEFRKSESEMGLGKLCWKFFQGQNWKFLNLEGYGVGVQMLTS